MAPPPLLHTGTVFGQIPVSGFSYVLYPSVFLVFLSLGFLPGPGIPGEHEQR